MNANHPYHQISAVDLNAFKKAIRIARWGGQKIFAKPSKDVISALRKTRKVAIRKHRYNLRQTLAANLIAQDIIAVVPETSAGSGLDLDAWEATDYLNVEAEGMGGGPVDFYLRIVCDYANRSHQRSNPARDYTTVGVSRPLDVVPRRDESF